MFFSPVLKLTPGFVYFHSSTTPRKKDMKYQSLCQVRHQRLLMQSILLSSRKILSPWKYCEKTTVSSCRWPQYFNCLGCFPDFFNFAFVCFASRRTGNREKLHVVKRKSTKHRVVYLLRVLETSVEDTVAMWLIIALDTGSKGLSGNPSKGE